MNKALFLDRDGVINVEKEYLYQSEDVEFIDGIFELTKKYQELGYLIVVVTNQSGIARGYYSQDDFLSLMEWMKETFFLHGVELNAVYFCPHHPDYSGECRCRKPKPGMFLDAIEALDINPKESIMIGDSERDITAARAAGVEVAYLLADSQNPTKATRKIVSLKELL